MALKVRLLNPPRLDSRAPAQCSGSPDLKAAIRRFNADRPIDRVLAEVGVNLKRTGSTNGGELHGPCPVCEAGTDRLRCYPKPTDGRARAICRQCGAAGDALHWSMRLAGIDPRTAGAVAAFLRDRGYLAERSLSSCTVRRSPDTGQVRHVTLKRRIVVHGDPGSKPPPSRSTSREAAPECAAEDHSQGQSASTPAATASSFGSRLGTLARAATIVVDASLDSPWTIRAFLRARVALRPFDIVVRPSPVGGSGVALAVVRDDTGAMPGIPDERLIRMHRCKSLSALARKVAQRVATATPRDSVGHGG